MRSSFARTGRLRRSGAVLALLALTLGACTGEETFEPVGGVDVSLTTASAEVRVGVIVSTQGPGASALGPAHGAVVAAARFNGMQAEGPVELVVADDLGDAQGAADAVDRLVDEGVVGIVMATVGPQVAAAAARADDLGMTLLAPLESDPAAVADTSSAWLTGPTDDQLATTLAGMEQGGSLLVLATDLASVPAALGGAVEVAVSGGLLGEQVTAELARTDPDPDAVVWWGAPEEGLGVVGALQRSDRLVPVALRTDALLPGFGRALATSVADGDLVPNTPLFSAGALPPEDGLVATRSFRIARDLVATRALPGLAGVATDDPGADLATADPRIHDAVLDLVAAAEEAGSVQAAAVVEALRQGGEVPGRVAPRPDYATGQTPFPDELVVLLQVTGMDAATTLSSPAAGPVLRWAPVATRTAQG